MSAVVAVGVSQSALEFLQTFSFSVSFTGELDPPHRAKGPILSCYHVNRVLGSLQVREVLLQASMHSRGSENTLAEWMTGAGEWRKVGIVRA